MKSKYTTDFKVKVIDSKILDNVIQTKKQLYYDSLVPFVDFENGVVSKVCIDNRWCNFVFENRSKNDIDCALLLLDSKKRKAQRVKDKITDLVMNNDAVFLTLTFTDSVIEKTSALTRRRYVARFLKQVSGSYAANIDFSPDINREHYHAVITKRVDLKSWKYGFAYAEKVRTHKTDLQRVSKYITKLTAHALKVESRLIYSRL